MRRYIIMFIEREIEANLKYFPRRANKKKDAEHAARAPVISRSIAPPPLWSQEYREIFHLPAGYMYRRARASRLNFNFYHFSYLSFFRELYERRSDSPTNPPSPLLSSLRYVFYFRSLALYDVCTALAFYFRAAVAANFSCLIFRLLLYPWIIVVVVLVACVCYIYREEEGAAEGSPIRRESFVRLSKAVLCSTRRHVCFLGPLSA